MSPNSTLSRSAVQALDEGTRYIVLVGGRDDEELSFGLVDKELLSSRPNATGALRNVVGRFYAAVVPFAVAASLFAPVEPRMITRVRSSAGTGIYQQDFSWFTDDWKYVPEYVSAEQVEDIRRLLASPPVIDVGFDFRAYVD